VTVSLIKSFVHLIFGYKLINMTLIIVANTFIALGILDILLYVTFNNRWSVPCMLMWIKLLGLWVVVESWISRILIQRTIVVTINHTIINREIFSFFLCSIHIVMSIGIRISFRFFAGYRSWL